jgi:hypothetical protein
VVTPTATTVVWLITRPSMRALWYIAPIRSAPGVGYALRQKWPTRTLSVMYR